MNLQERCMCGGLIVAGAPWDIPDAVRRHQRADPHRKWRRRRDLVETNRQYRTRLRDRVGEIRLERDLLAENGDLR